MSTLGWFTGAVGMGAVGVGAAGMLVVVRSSLGNTCGIGAAANAMSDTLLPGADTVSTVGAPSRQPASRFHQTSVANLHLPSSPWHALRSHLWFGAVKRRVEDQASWESQDGRLTRAG